jgi:hypothetical protein
MGYRKACQILQKPIILKQKDMDVSKEKRKKIFESYHDVSENKLVIVCRLNLTKTYLIAIKGVRLGVGNKCEIKRVKKCQGVTVCY